MKIADVRHNILSTLVGSRITPKQLFAMCSEARPEVNATSWVVNDCFDGNKKLACPNCKALGHFAVAIDGTVSTDVRAVTAMDSPIASRGPRAVSVPVAPIPVHVETLDEMEARVNVDIEKLEAMRDKAARESLAARVLAMDTESLRAILAARETEDEQSEAASA